LFAVRLPAIDQQSPSHRSAIVKNPNGALVVSQDIQQHILALHDRLERVERDSLEPRTRELLILLLSDLTRLLGATPSLDDDDDRPLTERLEVLAIRFEAEHPAVGNAVRQLIDALAKAGI
jgi:hypothetical protein